jgi:hypothetical protein
MKSYKYEGKDSSGKEGNEHEMHTLKMEMWL